MTSYSLMPFYNLENGTRVMQLVGQHDDEHFRWSAGWLCVNRAKRARQGAAVSGRARQFTLPMPKESNGGLPTTHGGHSTQIPNSFRAEGRGRVLEVIEDRPAFK